jgi:hypothetical protein
MAGIDEIPSGGQPRLAVRPPILAAERPLLATVGLPEEARHFVVARPDPTQKGFDPTLGGADMEDRLDPVGDLASVVAPSGLDLGLESFDLGATEPTGVALGVERGKAVEPLVLVETDPFSDLAWGNTQEWGDLGLGDPLVEPEEGTESGEDPFVGGLPSAFLDF